MIPGKTKPDIGTFLISEPFMRDGYFKRTVVLLTAQNEEGAVGYILNRPLDIQLKDVLPQCAESNLPVYLGGPVQRDNLFFIHSLGNIISNSIEIKKGLYWGGDLEVLVNLIQRNELKPDNVRFFIGYSGWSPGQLDIELSEKSWIVTKSKKEFIFNIPVEKLWGNVLKSMGNEYAQLANYPEDPSLN
jgi:putative transcriptional regulator